MSNIRDSIDDFAEAEEDDAYLVSCRCESAKAVSTLLSCLKHIGRSGTAAEAKEMSTQSRRRSASSSQLQPVTVFCSPTNLTFHVYGKSKQMQASVDIQSSLFSDYSLSSKTTEGKDDHLNEEWHAGGEFCVNLTTVLECLHVLGTHNLDKTKLCFSYNINKEIFKMELLEESGVLSTAAIPGMLPPEDDLGSDSLSHAFRSSPIVARIIVRSETLQELVSELDLVAGGSICTVLLGRNGLEMSVVGHLGECKIVLPVKGSHVVAVELPQITAPQPRGYPLHTITESMRGLEISEETCITMNNAGMMAIQHQVLDRSLSDSPSFVDFILCCLQEDDDDEISKAVSSSRESTSQISLACSQTKDGASVMTARVVSQKKMFPTGSDDDEENKSSFDRSSCYPTATEARLFGSVGAEELHPSPSVSRSSSRMVTRRRTRHPVKKRSRPDKTDSDSDTSRNLLTSDGDEVEIENEYMEETEPLDVTVLASPRRKRDHRADECSSPELVYGQQH